MNDYAREIEAVRLDIETLRAMIDLALDQAAGADSTNLRLRTGALRTQSLSPSWRASPSMCRAVLTVARSNAAAFENLSTGVCFLCGISSRVGSADGGAFP
jgi:hypothetical protein